ncbi:MAG TPA: acetyl-coenzyme A synthetase N-terminal domain-containing protein, partial [Gammaproteobacteria bacterium]|nr:acetyl-coenzyme A synthetase N-terminal domain-containing protein [Gammaproteobacteria bacterium]
MPNQLDFIPAWIPDAEFISTTNIARSMQELNIQTLKEFHRWTVDHYEEFWKYIINKLNIRFQKNPIKIVEVKNGVESPDWLVDAKLNIIDSCFTAPVD